MKKLTFLFMMTLILAACAPKDNNPEQWSDKQVNAWFNKQEWLNGWNVRPDSSINRRDLAVQYYRNKSHWDQLFKFLKTSDLKNMPDGRTDLDDDSLFVTISEYTSKDKDQTRYESHRKYIDIQYVISGKELMGIAPLDSVKVTQPYNEAGDIAYYNYDGGDYRLATPANFLIFFPENAHRPSLKAGDNEPVKKIVAKMMVK